MTVFGSGAPIPWEVDFRTEFGTLETLHMVGGWLHTTEERGLPAKTSKIKLAKVRGMSLE